MSSTIILVRHGSHDLLGKVLAGRMPGVPLNATGERQAAALADALQSLRVSAIYSSPVQRCVETAKPIAQRFGKRARIEPAFDELDAGGWTGKQFAELADDRSWQQWNSGRSLARCPGGESFLDVMCRVSTGLSAVAAQNDAATAVVVSHADVIKAMLCNILGITPDLHDRFEISAASRSSIVMGGWGAKVLSINEPLP